MISSTVHPLGLRARILLSSVFGPYARDDEFGSRAINPMELYQNQVTRTQGVFSLRMFHPSFGLKMLQANIDAPCTLLDFPDRQGFIDEISNNDYDIVGISAIMTNTVKVREMCRLVRKHLPRAVIVIGGHIANVGRLDQIIDADHIVKGDGVRWLRGYLGQDQEAPVRHPLVYSAFGGRILGVPLSEKPGSTAAILIPSVGCPLGCNFCSTSAMFGGKGKFVCFFETGDELFKVMCQMEEKLKVNSFFVLDENFLYHRPRALRLLELMEENGKAWSLSVFSSARVIKSYTMDQLIRLGISWVWMGVEGQDSRYPKLKNIDTRELVKTLQDNGICVLGSSIIGLEDHTPENIEHIMEYAVSHNTVFHQFMLYTPVPGTPLYEQHRREGTLLPETEVPPADAHGQHRFNYRHQHIKDGQERQYIIRAFDRDFEANGPSLARLIETLLNGWQKYKNHPDRRVRTMAGYKAQDLKTTYAGGIWAMKKWYRGNQPISARLDRILKRLYREFGIPTRIAAPVCGAYIRMRMKREDRLLANGWTYEPGTIREKNEAALALESSRKKQGRKKRPRLEWVSVDPAPVLGRFKQEY